MAPYLKWSNLFPQDEKMFDVKQLTIDVGLLTGNQLQSNLSTIYVTGFSSISYCYETILSGRVTHCKDAAKAGVLCFTSFTFCNNNISCSLRLNERIKALLTSQKT